MISLIDIWIFSQYLLRNVIYYPLFGQFSTSFGSSPRYPGRKSRHARRPLDCSPTLPVLTGNERGPSVDIELITVIIDHVNRDHWSRVNWITWEDCPECERCDRATDILEMWQSNICCSLTEQHIYIRMRYWVCLSVRYRNHLPVVQF